MAMSVPKAPGFAQMLKEGAKYFSGLEEAVYQNISACKELVQTTLSSYGPHGQNKMIINHLDKLFVTNDAATILQELDVQHPAAKIIVMASQQQEQECGDGTNFVMVFAGALLKHAAELLRMGLPVTEVVEGYELACKKALEVLPRLVIGEVKDVRNKDQTLPIIRTAIMSKQYGYEDFLSDIITDACISVYPEKTQNFNVDNIRVCKILGSGVHQSSLVRGFVLKRDIEGEITRADKCKVAVYTCPLDISQTETKGTVLIKNAKELLSFSKGEENMLEEQIKSIAATGCSVIVTGGKVGELALHFCNKYKLLVVRVLSKFDVRRICKAIQATALPKIVDPMQSEMGYCDHVYVDEIGDTSVLVFKQDGEESGISTIVVRGSTENIMNDVERAIDDGVNTFKVLTKDGRHLAGAGALEVELSKHITAYSEGIVGLEQYSIKKFADSLEALPRAIAQNTGAKATSVLARLYSAHHDGQPTVGVDVETIGGTIDAKQQHLYDLYHTKYWAIKFAVSSACTVLKVDQIIMAKPSGGPKPKDNKDADED